MSDWDTIRDHIPGDRLNPISSGFSVAWYFPSDLVRFFEMICSDTKGVWSHHDFYDLALFVEQFVLCNEVGVSLRFGHSVGPYLFEHYQSRSEMPFAIVSNYLQKLFAPLDSVETRLRCGDRGGLFVLDGIRGDKVEKSALNSYYSELSAKCDAFGISVAAGSRAKSHFKVGPQSALATMLYSEVSRIHREQVDRIANWTTTAPIYLPPLFSILLSRTKAREEMLPTLVQMRCQYADLRNEMESLSRNLRPGNSMREQLDAVAELERAREQILKNAVNRSAKSWLRRTWNIVKKGTAFGMFTSLADVLLDWDDERKLVSGVRHFIDMESLALNSTTDKTKLIHLFGEVQAEPKRLPFMRGSIVTWQKGAVTVEKGRDQVYRVFSGDKFAVACRSEEQAHSEGERLSRLGCDEHRTE